MNIAPSPLSAPLQRHAIRRVLVFRALQLGDMLCAVPALRALRGALPQARITLAGLPWAQQFAARFRSYIDDFVVFPGHPALPEQPVRDDQVSIFYDDLRGRDFDLALQLHGSGEVSNGIAAGCGARFLAGYGDPAASDANACFFRYPDSGPEPLRLLRLVELLGAAPAGNELEFSLTAADRAELAASGLAQGLVSGRYVCLHPGARSRAKCWPPACFAAVADRLAEEYGVAIVLTGSGKESDLTAAVAARMRQPALDAAAPISIGAMAALMRGARLLVCNDTGVSHIAAGLGLPSVVVFSQAELERWAPLDRTRHRCLRDPEGRQAAQVLQQARALLTAAGNA
jgi:ADP-heptose:LPS heptosyltransferase